MAAKVFVGNLPFSTTSNELETLFSQVGGIREVFLPMDRMTGRPRGFAFVEFEDPDAVAQAIEKFDGHDLNGRPIRVNAAEDRPPRAGGPRPSFDGGFGGDEGGGGRRFAGGKPKGSRRNLRARKRSL